MLVKAFNFLPHSPQLRRAFAMIFMLQGVGYWVVHFSNSPLTTSFQRQSLIMPMWQWAIVLCALGILLFFTSSLHWRRSWMGRGIALLCAGFAAWQFGTFWTVGAYTAMGQYVVTLAVFIGESVFLSTRGESV